MNLNPSFVRKVIYLCAIAALLFPLFLLGQPATPTRPGGQLAKLRAAYNLSEARLGEIDPASESMKLATLGMRGVAANILWHKANQFKKREDWDNLSATLNQITKLQPHFIAVWENQAHNLSYNVSVEFDDYRHRYHWVKKGIDFLIEGTRYNTQEPRLLWYTGWFFGQKFGRADEHRQFRRLFRTDSDFHSDIQQYVDVDRGARGPNNQPDTWLVGRLWYLEAQRLVAQGIPIRGKSPLIFHSQTPMSSINYAATIEEEGFLDEKAELAWRTAGEEWRQYGTRLIPTTWGENIRLNDLEPLVPQVEQLQVELEQLAPQAKTQAYEEKLATLSQSEKDVLDVPLEKRTAEQLMAAFGAEQKLYVAPLDIAQHAPEEIRNKAKRLAVRINTLNTTIDRIRRYRAQVNFEYWRMRCEAEQKPIAVQARKLMYEADRLKDDADLENARRSYEQAWQLWGQIFEEFPALVEDRSDDLAKSIDKYEDLLRQLDEKMPADFPLYEVREAQYRATGRTPTSAMPTADADPTRAPPLPKETPSLKETPAPAEKEPSAPAEKEPSAPAEKEAPAPAEKEPPAPAEKEAPAPAEKEPPAPAEKEAPAPAEKEAPAPAEKEPE